MKLISWNVNSVRTRLPRLLALLKRHQPDVVCLQETKVVDEGFPHEPIADAGYRTVTYGQKTYNGVAILSRERVDDVVRGFADDPQPTDARVVSATFNGVRLVNAYVINGKAVGSDKFALKLAWLSSLKRWLGGEMQRHGALLMMGDFNIAPDDRDVYDPEAWAGSVLCSEPERARLQELLGLGLRDLHRIVTDDGGIYTWWDYRQGAFPKNQGLRIDLALGSSAICDRLQAVSVDREERKKAKEETAPSDHAPLLVELAGP